MATTKRELPIGSAGQFKSMLLSVTLNGSRLYTNCKMGEDDYMKISPIWLKLREGRMKLDNYQCQKCGKAYNLVVHHIRYPEIWGEEDIKDLITLCDDCHKKTHNKEDE